MKSAISSLVLVLAAIIFTCFVAWFATYQWSQSRTIEAKLEHPLTRLRPAQPVQVIAWRNSSTDSAAPGSLRAHQAIHELSSKVWVWLDLRPTRDHFWVNLNHVELTSETDGQGLVGFKSLGELNQLHLKNTTVSSITEKPIVKDGAAPSLKIPSASKQDTVAELKAILAVIPNNPVVLNFREYRPGDDLKINQLLNEIGRDGNIVINADADGLLKDLRGMNAARAYATSQAQIAQMRMLIPIGLQGLISVRGDIVFALTGLWSGKKLPGKNQGTESIQSAHSRTRPFFTGPFASLEEELEWVSLGADGIITSNPERLCSSLRQRAIESCPSR
jgi:glycerophosphoryl diester phosphodiesterase